MQKRQKDRKIVEAARAAIYHQVMMWDQKVRLERLCEDRNPDDLAVNMEPLMALAFDLDLPTEALTISSSVIREVLGLTTPKTP